MAMLNLSLMEWYIVTIKETLEHVCGSMGREGDAEGFEERD
jgi:hypothetical protein